MDKGIDIFGGYGMSETCPIVSLAQLKPSMTDSSNQGAATGISPGM
jgi:fatty-acyl-CoA synthase